MCQHTAGCHDHQWRDLLEDEEITANYRVIAYDLPRHGKSDPPENAEWWKEEYRLSADHFARFIVALYDALELEEPIFVGSSSGGDIALQLAHRRPDRFAGVIPVEGADYSAPRSVRLGSSTLGRSAPVLTGRALPRARTRTVGPALPGRGSRQKLARSPL
ncbi:pimeloyl-ACP methyl ester carboxylesterase [Saccharopolyspora lacisalsi]|uniref:Pimeloyl-ACP methyl ester carboxylesterase n=1 Tax=Halosaccharopolyspora lacisalsi TaxID=1000566 RepID=A0A839E5E2_9PSEU|nr:alpha/beta hydrolase [Halosaccharopolyspora lacisalsi]MBA8826118.1 pimeloyl-ACP methyl ester carboxylesterase [Halosaccharopolyspora lacisalsi]